MESKRLWLRLSTILLLLSSPESQYNRELGFRTYKHLPPAPYKAADSACKKEDGWLPSLENHNDIILWNHISNMSLDDRKTNKIWLKNKFTMPPFAFGGNSTYVPKMSHIAGDCGFFERGSEHLRSFACNQRLGGVLCRVHVLGGACPGGFNPVSRVAGFCYKFSPGKLWLTWEEAKTLCENNNMSLATLDNDSQLSEIRTHFSDTDRVSNLLWLDLKRKKEVKLPVKGRSKAPQILWKPEEPRLDRGDWCLSAEFDVAGIYLGLVSCQNEQGSICIVNETRQKVDLTTTMHIVPTQGEDFRIKSGSKEQIWVFYTVAAVIGLCIVVFITHKSSLKVLEMCNKDTLTCHNCQYTKTITACIKEVVIQ